MNKENKIKYDSSVSNLLENIKKSYAGWGSDINELDEPSKSIMCRLWYAQGRRRKWSGG